MINRTFALCLLLLPLPLSVRSDEDDHLAPPPADARISLGHETDASGIAMNCAFTAGNVPAAQAAEELECLVKYLSHFEKDRRSIARSGQDVAPAYLKEAREHKAQAVLRIKDLSSWLGKLDTASHKS